MTAIIGQSLARRTLAAAVRSGRVQHAWVFAGPRGVGKFTTAIEFARALLDPQATMEADGTVRSPKDSHIARLIDAGTHPDLHIIRKESALVSGNKELNKRKLSNIPLDLLRERIIGGYSGEVLHEAAAYRTAALGHGKVFIIDEAELLDARDAQHALLKTLEEPPAKTWIILETSRPERLLPTVRSRCQVVRFAPLSEEEMDRWMTGAKLDVPAPERKWLLRFADGSPGTALLAAEYGFARLQQAVEPLFKELERGQFPVVLAEVLAEFVKEFSEAWVKRNKNASKDAANKDGARHALALVAVRLRDALVESSRRGKPNEALAVAMPLLREAEQQIESNVAYRFALENLTAQVTQRLRMQAA